MILLSGPGGSASDYELLTKTAFESFAGITTGGADDSLITTLVNGVNRAVHRELGGRFLKSTGTQYDMIIDNFSEQRHLWLPEYPIVSITSIDWVRVAGNDVFESWRSYANTEYQTNKQNGMLIPIYFTWPMGPNVLRIKFYAGYDSIPADITEALATWIMVKLQRVADKRLDVVSISTDVQSQTFTFDDMPPACKRILDGYRYPEASVA